MSLKWPSITCLALLVGTVACSEGETIVDAGTGPADAGTTAPDAGTSPDAGTPKDPPGSACAGDDDCVGPNATCITSMPNGYCVKDCTLATQCPSGTKCLSTGSGGACVASCETDNDCRKSEGYYCDQTDKYCMSATYVPTNEGGAAIGEPCTSPEACEGGVCLPETTSSGIKTGYTGGYCMAQCTESHPESCPAGATCLNGYCRDACTTDADCRGAPYACVDGTCRLDPAVVPVGAACAQDSECPTGAFCVTEASSFGAFPGGMCVWVDDCNPDTGSGCAAGGRCLAIHDLYGDGTTYPACVQGCASDTDCRSGYICDASSKACRRPASNTAKVKLGAACAQDSDCDVEAGAGGVCAKGAAYPDGYCVAGGCSSGGQAGGANDTCVAHGGSCWVIPEVSSYMSYCIKSCAAESECRGNGYTCDADKTCWYYE